MCIVCHYKGDSILVTRETREQEHSDRVWHCLRRFRGAEVYFCFDCKVFVPDKSHVCDVLPVHPPSSAVTIARRKRARALNEKRAICYNVGC
jgi:hypothetical protein